MEDKIQICQSCGMPISEEKQKGNKHLLSESTRVIKGIQGLADFLSISRSVAQKIKNEGVIPYIQYDRIVLFEPDKVLMALAAQTQRYNK